MGIEAKTLSAPDTLRLQAAVTAPAFFWGLVAPNRLLVPFLSRGEGEPAALRLLGDLRQKYQADHLWSWFPFARTLLVLDPESMEEVLRSEDNFADPVLKKQALSRFVPDALTISSGAEWQDRRRFNESALSLGRLHPHAEAFREIVFREVDELVTERPGEMRWSDFQTLGERIAHQVLLGAGRFEPHMSQQMAHLASRGNLPVLPKDWGDFSAFYERIDRHLERHRAFVRGASRGPGAGDAPVATRCLMHDSATLLESGSATESTRVPRQIGFWFFVLKDAIELHVARTLALVAAHAEVQDRVLEELRSSGTSTAEAIDGLRYLGDCTQEQMRLWTPVPILLRRVHSGFALRGAVPVRSGEQILIHAGRYHRDPQIFGERANQFSPDAASDPGMPPVYVFSRHRQSCAGESLARFLIKATLAALLARSRFDLIAPAVRPGRIPYQYDHFHIVLRSLGHPSTEGRVEP